uniref:Uncharacterized protein n=1 Tax=Octopus bimaculoides TaxID=37653 RepID=A0A0L8GGG2_OCTBM
MLPIDVDGAAAAIVLFFPSFFLYFLPPLPTTKNKTFHEVLHLVNIHSYFYTK